MRLFLRSMLLSIGLALVFSASHAVTLKLGSLAPADSPWDLSLKEIASEWRKISDQKVTLRIYPGGIAGDEADMIRKIRIGQLDAAALTATGLSRISSQVLAINLPLFYKNEEELTHVLKDMKPRLESILKRKKFIVLVWNRAGWIHFFSKKPVSNPNDLKTQKIAVTASSADLLSAWRSSGFQAVPLDTINVMAGLQSGMIDATYTTPIGAATYQWFGIAKYMCPIKVAPLVGAVVIGARSWNKIPNSLHARLIESAVAISSRLGSDVRRLEAKAMDVMKKNGLIVTPLSKEAEMKWMQVVKTGHRSLIGSFISEEIYQEVLASLKAFRDDT